MTRGEAGRDFAPGPALDYDTWEFGPDPLAPLHPRMDPPRQPDQPAPPTQARDALLACFQRALGHELPSRLVALQGLLRVLEMETPDLPPEARDYLGRAADLARRAHALTRELADLGRVLRNPPGPHPSGPLISVGEAAREAIAEVNQVAKGLPVTYHVDPVTDSLAVPWPGLAQVLARLLRHVVRIGFPAAGRAGESLRINVDARPMPGGLEIRIGSDAPAPPASQLDRLFEPFVGAPGPVASELGLFPVRLLLESWGSGVRASAGPGLTFTLGAPLPPGTEY